MMEKDWLFATDAYICDLRTVAVVMKDNKVLVQREKDGTEYALPGGHVKIGETLEEGLIPKSIPHSKSGVCTKYQRPFPHAFRE